MRDIKKVADGVRSPLSVDDPVIIAIDNFLKFANQNAPPGEQSSTTAAALRELSAAAIAFALFEELVSEDGQDAPSALLQNTFRSVQYRAVELFGEFSRYAVHPSELN